MTKYTSPKEEALLAVTQLYVDGQDCAYTLTRLIDAIEKERAEQVVAAAESAYDYDKYY